jgi:ferredoxin
MSKVRMRVDPIKCTAHGLCAELLPELIQLDDWGYPIIDHRAIPEKLRGYAEKAVAACPALALMLEQAEAKQI